MLKGLEKWIKVLSFDVGTVFLQKTTLSGTARILRKVLDTYMYIMERSPVGPLAVS